MIRPGLGDLPAVRDESKLLLMMGYETGRAARVNRRRHRQFGRNW